MAFSLTTSTRKPVTIFLASSAALVLSALIAALLGGAAEKAIPRYTQYVSVGLFVLFGIYILLSREIPRVKEGFLKAIAVEKMIVHLLPKILRRAGADLSAAETLLVQKQAHADWFRQLVREKRLFKDDINEEEELLGLIDRLKFPGGILRMRLKEALELLIDQDEASPAFFEFLHRHLDSEHHDEMQNQQILLGLIEEEEKHREILRSFMERHG